MTSWLTIIIIGIYFLQLLSLIAVIFIENKDPLSTVSWIFVLSFLPIIGFIFYLFLGRGLTHLFNNKLKVTRELKHDLKNSFDNLEMLAIPTASILTDTPYGFTDKKAKRYTNLMKMNYMLSNSLYTQNNDAYIYTDAREKYDDLFQDIKNAKSSVHLIYFIISNTTISHELVDLLAEKAKEGVEVRLIYDEIGNLVVPARMFNKIKDAGGEVYKFFPLTLTNLLHANYRNHHKIAVIDGVIGYTGGMNIGDEYMGLHHRKTPWRDTHLKVTGSSVASLQTLFIIDYVYVKNNVDLVDQFRNKKYFPSPIENGNLGVQVVSSGPDDDLEAIKRAFMSMISTAKKSIYIQTPYLMPDPPLLEAIQNAAVSGVDVKLMLPGIPDKRIAYQVTYSYIKNMLDYGVKVYIYDGFLHSKMIVADDSISTIGTTNLDMRSLSLHFEVNLFFYDRDFSKECSNIFIKDLNNCHHLTKEEYDNRGRGKRFFERIFRLFAPLM